MSAWAGIQYRDFYDVPRMFLTQTETAVYLFDSRFSDVNDEYDDHYEVYLMPKNDEMHTRSDWRGLEKLAIRHLGRVKVSSVEFDNSKRKEVNLDVLAKITS